MLSSVTRSRSLIHRIIVIDIPHSKGLNCVYLTGCPTVNGVSNSKVCEIWNICDSCSVISAVTYVGTISYEYLAESKTSLFRSLVPICTLFSVCYFVWDRFLLYQGHMRTCVPEAGIKVSRPLTNNYILQYMWEVITSPCHWHLLVAPKF